MARYARSEAFFPIMTLVVLAFILLGFGSGFAMTPEGGFPPHPALVLHGLVTLAWFILTLVQAWLIRNARFPLHQTLGWASLGLATAIIILGYFTIASAMARTSWSIAGFDNIGSTIFPFFDLVTFAIVYALGIGLRKQREAHKRLMVLAGVMMMDPAVARTAMFIFGAPPVALLFELAILLAFPIYDWRTRGKPHWASVFGVALFVGCFALRMALGGTAAWSGFAQAFF